MAEGTCQRCKRKRKHIRKDGFCEPCVKSAKRYEQDTLRRYRDRLEERALKSGQMDAWMEDLKALDDMLARLMKKGGKLVPPYD